MPKPETVWLVLILVLLAVGVSYAALADHH